MILVVPHGRTFLTGPWFATRPGYYQGEPIAAGIGDLPALDGVLLTHAHCDHCDLQAFAAYRARDVPLCVAATVTGEAGKHGFGNVTPLEPWQHAEADGVSITAAPAKHGVPEVTYVLRSGSDAVYFAGDTLLIPELSDIPERLGHICIALLPVNGLQIRPAGNMQVVMNATEAAQLTAILNPELAIPTTTPSPAAGSATGSSPTAAPTPAASATPPTSSRPPPRSRSPTPAPGWNCEHHRRSHHRRATRRGPRHHPSAPHDRRARRQPRPNRRTASPHPRTNSARAP